MKRDHFIKTLATLAGGLTVVGCNPSLIDEIVAPDGTPDDLGIGDAEQWFKREYLPRFSGLQNERRGQSHKRNASWEKAQKPRNRKNKDFGWVWVPLAYEGLARPGVVLYDEDTLYRLELRKYFLQPIIEGIVVVKTNGENKAFLAQIAYDPFELAANGYKLEKSTFTGTLLRADWSDNLIDGTVFEKGEMIRGFTNPANAAATPAMPASENARTGSCGFYRVEYTTSYVDTDGVFTLVGHTAWMVHCDISGNGGWDGIGSGSGGYSGAGGRGGGTVGRQDSVSSYYDPLVDSGAGAAFPINMVHNFNLERAIATDGTDRMKMNANLLNALNATQLGLDITTWSYAKADALARSIGGNLKTAAPLLYTGLRRVGIASLLYSSTKAVIVVADGGSFTTEELVILGGTLITGLAALYFTGWIAVGFGAVNVGIAIYDMAN